MSAAKKKVAKKVSDDKGPTWAPEPKSTKKKVVKKKTAKKPSKKKAAKKKAAPKKNGLTGNEVKVLTVLKSGRELNRVQLAKATGINTGWAKLLGAASREDYGVQGGGLAGKGLVKVSKHEDSPKLVYVITPKGQKAIS